MTTKSELRSKIAAQNAEISQIAHRIEDRVESYRDWKAMVRQRPLQSLGIAMGVGFLLAGAGRSLFGLMRAANGQAMHRVSHAVGHVGHTMGQSPAQPPVQSILQSGAAALVTALVQNLTHGRNHERLARRRPF